MRIITVANQKGGVAKTTTVVTLAHALALRGKETLIVDVDPQGQCALALGVGQESAMFDLLVNGRPLRDVVRTTGREDLYLIPGDKRTATAQNVMILEGADRDTLARVLGQRGSGGLDYVVIDTPPAVAGRRGLQEQALYAADLVVIPCAMDYLSTAGVAEIVTTMDALAGDGWAGALLGILPTFYDEVTRESKVTLEDLRAAFGIDRVLTPVHRATILRECAASGKTIWEVDPKSRVALEYADLTWRVSDGR